MARITIYLEKEHIALIKSLYFQKLKSRELIIDTDYEDVANNIRKIIPWSNFNCDAMGYNEKISDIVKSLAKEIKAIRLQHIDDYVGIDTWNLYGGAYLYEDMARILGLYDKVIPETKEDPLGPRFPKEIEDKFAEYDDFMVKNLVNIEEIIHQFCDKGGLKVGKYVCQDYSHIWSYEGIELHKQDEQFQWGDD